MWFANIFHFLTLLFSVKLKFFAASQSGQSYRAVEVVCELSECVGVLEANVFLQIAKNVVK
jgi:uncharacterized ion transporter superfamily protein YfcC